MSLTRSSDVVCDVDTINIKLIVFITLKTTQFTEVALKAVLSY